MKIEIKARWTGAVLFSLDCESIKICLQAAVKSGADLRGAYLGGADLSGAYLSGAYLSGSDLSGADLRDAYPGGADLRGSDLSGADLSGAYLSGSDLRGSDLSGAKVDGFLLVGERPILQIGPIGSRNDYLLALLTAQGIRICAGCFSGTLAEFSAAVTETHGQGVHGKEYAAAILMIEAHATIWTPAVDEIKAAA